MKKILIEQNDVNKRLDVFLSEKTDFSRSQIKNFITNGKVLVGGNKVKAGHSLRESDEIVVDEFTPPETNLVAEDLALDIVFQNQNLAVINKAQGMVVHPAAGNFQGTLVNALLFHFDKLSTSEDVRPGIVHRLDKNTSGLMLVAKNNKAHAFLAKQIKDKVCVREYVALCSGNFKSDKGTVTTGLGRDKKNRKKMSVYPLGQQKEAITTYEVLERYVGFCLVKFVLKTGRTHQIRVHASSLGHPIVGDEIYGGNTKLFSNGQLLHSRRLEFFDLDKTEKLVFESPLPDYFEKVIGKLNKNY